MSNDAPPKLLDTSFFDGRMMIDILSWDWNLRLALDPTAVGPKARPPGLAYRRDFTIEGRIRTPVALGGKIIKVELSPFGPKVRFGQGGLKQVGRIVASPPDAGFDFEATLLLPEDAISTTATSLASNWKHLSVWTFDQSDVAARVAAYSFAAQMHPSVGGGAGD